jgi:transcriptional regulator with XRE-family HTH domain
MASEGLTGSRIRERRTIVGLKQADLARKTGISASYLNLIEHNRRRIGGKLLLDIAALLGVQPSALTEGAEAALISGLREAAVGVSVATSELDRAEEFAGRFPGWAEVLSNAHRRILKLERTVETLNDRMAHDPQVAASVHELLTTAAAIRSTGSILAEDKTITKQWRDKFHANIDQDSRRLSDSAKALVGYLDSTDQASDVHSVGSPQDELDTFLESHDYTFAGIEAGTETADDLLQDAPQLVSIGAKHIARLTLERLQSDAKKVSLAALRGEVVLDQLDPIALARRFDVPMSLMLRRLAALPDLQTGMVVCDRSGSFVFRKPVTGFAIPRFGAACPLWPLFDVFALPGQVARRRVHQVGRGRAEFDCFAVAEAAGHADYNNAPLVQATMLIVPLPNNSVIPSDGILQVGSTCRVCARVKCSGRREPSILSEGF